MQTNKKLIYPELSYEIVGVLFKARSKLGGFKNEKQYCDMIEALLEENGIPYEREKILPESFEKERRGRSKVDFIVKEKIILEIKAKPFLTKQDYYQIRRYLSVTNKKLGILVNMRQYYIHPKRVLNSEVDG